MNRFGSTRTRSTTALAVCALTLTACSGGSEARSDAATLVVSERPIPALRVPHYRTSGTYPHVSGGKLDLRAVNAALRQAVIDNQDHYARSARDAIADWPESLRLAVLRKYAGIYRTSTTSRSMSASTVVVSALIPVLALLPGGNDGDLWVSVTLRVPSGARVPIGDLFADPSRGLDALAKAVTKELIATNPCVRSELESPIGGRYARRGLLPRLSNYRHFALTAEGFVVGFPINQVGGPPCGRVHATVPYAVVRPYLSKLGESLIVGVRSPSRPTGA